LFIFALFLRLNNVGSSEADIWGCGRSPPIISIMKMNLLCCVCSRVAGGVPPTPIKKETKKRKQKKATQERWREKVG